MANEPTALETWDPLAESPGDEGLFIAAQRREIRNILKSYTGYYDLFAELIQNSLDAVERRQEASLTTGYKPSINIVIDLKNPSVTVSDNGIGMELSQFKSFLRPNLSYKNDATSRGCKGVGATYLGYGFNHLEVATRKGGKAYSGKIVDGRKWVEDKTSTVARPKVESFNIIDPFFEAGDDGTTMRIRLIGENIRPKDLKWIGATDAKQWMSVLRAVTPLGGIYLCSERANKIQVKLTVIDSEDKSSEDTIEAPEYLWPHSQISKTIDLREFIKYQEAKVAKGEDVTLVPAKYKGLSGIWGEWTITEMLDRKSKCPIQPRLDSHEEELAKSLDIRLYIFLAFSVELWDSYNDNTIRLRRGHRLLRGGLQLATRHMPQGELLTIPMTNNIGFQNMAHVIVSFADAEPDLGRKGFQPDQVRVAEKLSVSATTALRKRYNLLRKPGQTRNFGTEIKLQEWIRAQEAHAKAAPLCITGKGLFCPTEILPIVSEPIVEQDVVALFNQMLSAGLIRGIELISSSQHEQYDGLYKIKMKPPFDKYIIAENNPLGIESEAFADHSDGVETIVKILEYKFTLDGLIEEIQSGMKSAADVSFVVVWEMGEKWRALYDVVPYLDPDHRHHRIIHGSTHGFNDSLSGQHVFDVIILKDLIEFLTNRDECIKKQRSLIESEPENGE